MLHERGTRGMQDESGANQCPEVKIAAQKTGLVCYKSNSVEESGVSGKPGAVHFTISHAVGRQDPVQGDAGHPEVPRSFAHAPAIP